ncbi:VCBS repeat-containing protein [Streptomyces sp. YC504]|uniref:VCBS repeat-containing protein n=1 Tax=Streptomyces mesophilus TaxID=1775132 RepID=A0A6G4XKT1_9ACTN|nr:VCBS repeat-containing protein [Streptomyces mesophilus]NGO77782.1 VCBS repeat-containing protein [Streptomyces mesophilus]
MRRMIVTALVPVLVLGGVGALELTTAPAAVAVDGQLRVWEVPKQLSPSDSGAYVEEMLTLEDGSTVLVWQQLQGGASSALMASVRPGGSEVWGAPQVIAHVASAHSPQPAVTEASDGSVTVAWEDLGGSYAVHASTLAAGTSTWSTPVKLGPVRFEVGEIRLASGPDGRIVAVWTSQEYQSRDVYFAERDPADGAWSPPTRFGSGTRGVNKSDPGVEIAEDGAVSIVWQESNGSAIELQESSRAAGDEQWTDPRTLSSPGKRAFKPQLTVAPDGTFALAWWEQGPDTDAALLFARRSAGSTEWGTPETAASGRAYVAQMSRPLFGPQGEMTVVWVDGDPSASQGLRAATRSSSGAWGTTTVANGPLSLDSDAVIGADGTVQVGWGQGVGDDRAFTTAARVNGVWSAPKTLAANPGGPAEGVVTVAADGEATAVWKDGGLWTSTTDLVTPAPSRDYVGKDKIADLYTVKTTGELGIYGGTATGRVSSPAKWVAWPTTSTLVPFGDVNGDGCNDTLVRNSAGELHSYRAVCGSVVEPNSPSARIGSGWNVYNAFTSPGDLDKDGTTDLLARETSTGRLWFYGGDGKGAFKPRTLIGAGWGPYTVTGTGDLNGDGIGDLVARDSDGVLWNYPGNGNGAFGSRVRVGSGWGVYKNIVGVGDLTGDGRQDLVASDTQGLLWRYDGVGDGTFKTRVQIGSSGWQHLNLS